MRLKIRENFFFFSWVLDFLHACVHLAFLGKHMKMKNQLRIAKINSLNQEFEALFNLDWPSKVKPFIVGPV